MAIFSGKIISAKFIDDTDSVIEILYNDNDNIISYVLNVDYENEDFKSLLDEYTLEKIELETKEIRKKEIDIFNSLVEARANLILKSSNNEGKFTFNDFFSFIQDNEEDTDSIFEFKVAILEDKQVSEIKDKTIKAKIRKCKNFYELLSIYGEIKSKG